MASIDRWGWFDKEASQGILQFQQMAIDEFNQVDGALTPPRVISLLNILSACQNLIGVEMHTLAVEEAKWMTENRIKYGSDKMAKNFWMITENGTRQHDLKGQFDIIKNTLQALKKTYNYLESEARNQF